MTSVRREQVVNPLLALEGRTRAFVARDFLLNYKSLGGANDCRARLNEKVRNEYAEDSAPLEILQELFNDRPTMSKTIQRNSQEW
jgi:hypothetical protein